MLVLCCYNALGQAGAGMKLGDHNQHYIDSVQRAGYPYRFPILGAKVVAKGFNIQYPVGAMLNMMVGKQNVTVSDLKVGFNDQEPVSMDFIQFGKVEAHMFTTNARVDLWLLPFLDVYGILGYTQAQTNVSIVAPFQFTSKADFKGHTIGLGTTLAGGYHNIITITDINYTWTNMDKLDKTVKNFMVTPRIGYNIQLPGHVNKSIALWIGASGCYVNHGTVGSIDLSDLHPSMDPAKAQAIVDETEAWYQQLSKPQQLVVKQLAQAILNKLNGLPDDIVVHYSLDKRPQSNWNMTVGGQYQFNKRWQVRTEVGFLGGRNTVLISGNYRWRW